MLLLNIVYEVWLEFQFQCMLYLYHRQHLTLIVHMLAMKLNTILYYKALYFVISVSTVPLNSGIKILTCSNGEQWCPLAACAGSICTLLYRCNLIIFKCELLLGSGIVT